MSTALILHSSIDGHTVKICERLQAKLAAGGHAVRLHEIGQGDEAMLRAAELVVIGASIRYGSHRPAVLRFMREHRALLEARQTALFSVNVVARKPAKSAPDTNPYLRKFLLRLGWRPPLLAVFAGRIDYPGCRFVDRQMIRLIMWITKGPTDLRQAHEFTDWAQVDAFADRLVKSLSA